VPNLSKSAFAPASSAIAALLISCYSLLVPSPRAFVYQPIDRQADIS
jgi:hypothetical protein